jgi:hypothetical protein
VANGGTAMEGYVYAAGPARGDSGNGRPGTAASHRLPEP